MSQNGKLMPNLDQQSTKVLNLTVLQRNDPFVEEILMTSTHVTFYKFDTNTSQWSRKDVEGSLFVVKRNAQPRFQFIVMNRLNTENLVEDLLGDFECEVQLPYLLYRNAAREVNGIWFYNASECEEVANLFSRILGAYSKVPQKSTVSTTKSEFEELEAVPSMDVMDGPLEPSSSTASNIADAPDDHAFVNFFSAASHTAVAGQAYQSSTISVPLHQVGFAPSTISNMHISSPPQLSTAPSVPFLDVPESHSNTNLATSLVKPSSFFVTPPSPATVIAPVSSSVPSAPLFQPAVSLQRPYGAPLLQPFPPPAPPPSLTPASFSTSNYGPLISRDKVRDALRLLVQDNQFVDMVHLALLKAHHS
ncbi:putative mRNA-decapping enzyme subunit 1, PH domain-containing protein [Rosa chinensis]|uniref:Putative mRNA-decapping enzyme subunit 1, PH domain-containing protein n=1 Tax=Rosa chinensis TaxID=74649 RepID=A0A2P6QDW7_ROSCH|nr:mRNA-decapping enzyme-like protein [Rosa chinensis]PRQ32382.1 putative mRNA-decapping enzyme subunit 1, PH domain-containing protein [Rosa chinensis]